MNPFTEKLTQLANGEMTELIVERTEFFLFREAWIAREDKDRFEGTAGQKGQVVYRYQ